MSASCVTCGKKPVSVGFRVDGLSGGGDVQFKGISVREIVGGGTPNTSGGGTTTTPPTTGGGTTPPAEEEEEDGGGGSGTTIPTCNCPSNPRLS